MHYAVVILIGLIVAGAGGWAAHRKGDAAGFERRDLACKIEIADIRSHAAEVERQAQAEREKGRLLADRLATQLADAREALAATDRRLRDEIQRRASATRRALDGDLVRVLNESAEIRESVEPTGARGAAAARATEAPAAATAADRDRPAGGGASERAVASWIASARTSYANCVATLTALQDWARAVTR